jgi:hypothetical protein
VFDWTVKITTATTGIPDTFVVALRRYGLTHVRHLLNVPRAVFIELPGIGPTGWKFIRTSLASRFKREIGLARREKHIETRLVNRVKSVLHGRAYKWTSPAQRSVPDRIVLLPGHVVLFVELKAPGKDVTELQFNEHERLRKLGFRVEVIDSYEGVDWLIEDLRQEAQARAL